MDIPFSQACENNKTPILGVFQNDKLHGDVLEIGHGTGQHAIYFAENLPVQWYASDCLDNLWMLAGRKVLPKNLHHSLELEVGKANLWHQVNRRFDHVYTANTLHIMAKEKVEIFCEQVHQLLNDNGRLYIYGPFKFDGNYTSDSNAAFDQHLMSRDPQAGIRDFEFIRSAMRVLKLVKTLDLPANNNMLIFEKS